jgi:hypothetical protein
MEVKTRKNRITGIMEYWNTGIVYDWKYWKIGMLEYWLLTHHSIIPPFQHSNLGTPHWR